MLFWTRCGPRTYQKMWQNAVWYHITRFHSMMIERHIMKWRDNHLFANFKMFSCHKIITYLQMPKIWPALCIRGQTSMIVQTGSNLVLYLVTPRLRYAASHQHANPRDVLCYPLEAIPSAYCVSGVRSVTDCTFMIVTQVTQNHMMLIWIAILKSPDPFCMR